MKISKFFSRWKQGIKDITPFQQAKISLIGNIIILIGILIGLYSTWKTKWLFIVLLGSLFLAVVGLLGASQKYYGLKKINEILKGGENEI